MEKYNVTENGDVINIRTGKKLKPRVKDNHYLFVTLCEDKQRHKYIHRLVAEKFIPNPLGLPQVNHLDGNKQNNHYLNLEWCDQNRNIQHAWDNGLMKPNGCIGVKNGRVILNETQVREIRSKYIPQKYTIPMLVKEYGVSYGTIQAIILRKNWKHI